MSYYDNVKDNVRNKGGENEDDEGSSAAGASFDTLKEAAEETSEQEDKEDKGDGTPIEVLEDGGLNEAPPSQQSSSSSGSTKSQSGNERSQSQQKTQETSQNRAESNPLTRSSGNSNVEQKLDRIIEQNEKMIEILESFGS